MPGTTIFRSGYWGAGYWSPGYFVEVPFLGGLRSKTPTNTAQSVASLSDVFKIGLPNVSDALATSQPTKTP